MIVVSQKRIVSVARVPGLKVSEERPCMMWWRVSWCLRRLISVLKYCRNFPKPCAREDCSRRLQIQNDVSAISVACHVISHESSHMNNKFSNLAQKEFLLFAESAACSTLDEKRRSRCKEITIRQAL